MPGTTDPGSEHDWFFTFGYGQLHGPKGYVKIYGTGASARTEMIRRHGDKWSFQYTSAESAGVKEYNLMEVK